MKRIHQIIASVENIPLSLASFVVSFFALIVTRLLIENALLGLFQERTFFYFFFEFTHTLLFFLFAFILLIPVARFAGEVDFQKAVNVLFGGFFIILIPPIIDAIVFRGGQFWSFYEFDGFFGLLKRYVTLFGDTPDMGITYGVRIEVVLVTLGLGLYAFLKSRRIGKALLTSILAYTILFVLGTFPSWLTLGIMFFQKSFFAINQNDVAALFLTPENIFARNLADFRSVLNVKMSIVYAALSVFLISITLWREFPHYFLALWKNARLPQIVYHGGLLVIGMALAFFFTATQPTLDLFHISGVLVLLASIESAWLASVVVNDCYDIKIDKETNPTRPLIINTIQLELYRTFGVLFFIVSLIFAGIISFSALLLLLGYQAIAWLYSVPPFRLKRFPIVATIFSSFAGLLIFILGFLTAAPSDELSRLPLSLWFFLFVAYAIALPVKDFKDIKGDELDCIYTIPVLLGAEKAKLLIGSLIFFLYIISPIILNARVLFGPALLCGGITFWSIQKSVDSETTFFSHRKLPGIVLAITAAYAGIIAYLLF
jgi:homogentisate phytyltransferase / homogentisate geranylgeranyltransferase